MIALPTLVLVTCVISSLWLHSWAWVAGVPPAHQGTRMHQHSTTSSSDRSCFRPRVMTSGRSCSRTRVRQTAPSEQEGQEEPLMAGNPEEKQSGAPVEQQPWWEEERKTKGLPTLSKATQWRMFLSLKVQATRGTCMLSFSGSRGTGFSMCVYGGGGGYRMPVPKYVISPVEQRGFDFQVCNVIDSNRVRQ